MKIKLFTYLEDSKNTYLNATVILKAPHQRILTKFILDTGSPQTIISYSDALRLQVPFNSLSKEEIISIGGRKYQGYSYNKLKFVFMSEENKQAEEEVEVRIIKPTSIKEMEEVDRIPTIIGTDFLKNKNYKLFCDFAKGEAYLEK